jgi:hypothetical protein
MKLASLCTIGLMAALLGGCAHTEFDMIAPGDQARRIGKKDWTSVTLDPIEYRMISYDDHLIVRAYNRADTPIRLLAEQGTAVDPAGQSHPLPVPNQTILPGSYVKLILPPNRTRIVPSGPSINIGIGAGFGYGYGRRRYFGGFGYHDPYWYGSPRYYTVYGPGEAVYWNWPKDGTARLVLVYAREAGLPGIAPTTGPADLPPPRQDLRFSHEFQFKRLSVK